MPKDNETVKAFAARHIGSGSLLLDNSARILTAPDEATLRKAAIIYVGSRTAEYWEIVELEVKVVKKVADLQTSKVPHPFYSREPTVEFAGITFNRIHERKNCINCRRVWQSEDKTIVVSLSDRMTSEFNWAWLSKRPHELGPHDDQPPLAPHYYSQTLRSKSDVKKFEQAIAAHRSGNFEAKE